jgi:hypothetical protein
MEFLQMVAMQTVEYSLVIIWLLEGPEVITDFQEEVAEEAAESPIKIVNLPPTDCSNIHVEAYSLGMVQTSFSSLTLRFL